MRCTPSPGYLDAHSLWIHWIILLGGLALTTLVVSQLMLMRNRTNFVEALVEKRTTELRESEERYRAVVENTPVLICRFLPDGEITYVNETYCKYFEKTSEELVGQTFLSLIPESDRETVMVHISALTVESPTQSQEHRVIAGDGDIRWQRWTNHALFDAEGKVVAYQSIGEDVTKRKLAEEALRESESIYRKTIENASGVPYQLDLASGKYVFIGAGIKDLIGIAQEEFIPQAYSKMIIEQVVTDPEDPEDHATYGEAFWRGETAQYRADVRIQTPSGNVKWISDYAVPIRDDSGKVVGSLGILLDITERKKAEDRLMESKTRYRALFQSAGDAIFMMDGEQFINCNPKTLEMFGCTRDQIIGKPPYQFSPKQQPDGRDSQEQALENINLALSGKPQRFEWLHCRHDGTPFHAEVSLNKIELSGKLFLQAIGIGIVDENEKVTFCNPAYASIFEEDDPENMIGKSLLDYTGLDQQEIILQQTARRLRRESSQYEIEITTAKNNRRILLVSVSPHLDENGRYIGAFGNVIDITETKRLQALESRAERLETAGKIAGQVAHDFNNLLGPLMAYPDMIRDDLPNNHPALVYLDDIESAAEKISDINQDLLAMGRRGHYNQEVINLNRIVSHAVNVIDTRSSTISCETDLCDDLMNVMGGASQIDRCISNLLCNAQDALHGVGTITIKTENYYIDDVSIVYGRVPKGEYVKVTVSDTGCGIPDDIIQKIFDPFFTSKTADKKRGSGLGLSVVDAVMKDHNAYLDLSSKVGGGTSFYLYFPVTRETADVRESVQIIGGTETILIIDDDDIQRDVSTKILKKLGYAVSEVESGEKAIEFLKDNPQDLLVLDMVMSPGIDGAETYRLISRIYPGQKAIIVSGFSESGLVLWAQALGAGAFVRKPFTKTTIGAAIRTELDRVKRQHA
jgi:PAS domain S-box-containing protein